jgi:hypothetical protein
MKMKLLNVLLKKLMQDICLSATKELRLTKAYLGGVVAPTDR